ncbi:ATP-binding cassette domain-containing protein [Lachnospiraceae bacterium OttesenSCG-928-D06]|nr:ATP-binding cassette domain-containing protein [Lachnospiraceae bacterium OttesenSCG-928-D06]
MDYILTTTALTKEYGSFKAVSNLNMHVEKGSIYGMIGRNGAGKTTLIRLICGLQAPTLGEYCLYGKKHTDQDIAKARRRMGAIVETPSIYLHMTATENLQQQFSILGLPSFEGIPELLKLVNLESTGKKKAKDFSLGMRQRLGIAVALAGNPDLLVLDEPVNGLDPQGIIEIRELILKLNREQQITVIISSHYLDELSKLATHYGFLHKGQLIKEISAVDLNAACRKCTCLTVSDTKALARTLDTMNLEYSILSDSQGEVYGTVNISTLVLTLAKEGCNVSTVTERDESLESYYISLVGGDSHE